ncbi:MAG TPA: hypothetical protein VD994_14855 [Prosthecobacter sp.]|nr:hypothetical protein [Prosthecobacter sp.]
MKTKLPHMERRLERHLATTAADLPALEEEIEHIGGVAHTALHHRLHNVAVMEQALRRNYDEVLHLDARPPGRRVRKLRRLCRCIEKEFENLRQEAEFLAMGSASTLISFVEGTNGLLNRWLQRLGRSRDHA